MSEKSSSDLAEAAFSTAMNAVELAKHGRDLHLRLNLTGLTNLPSLKGLDALLYLDISDTRVADLGPLNALPQLR